MVGTAVPDSILRGSLFVHHKYFSEQENDNRLGFKHNQSFNWRVISCIKTFYIFLVINFQIYIYIYIIFSYENIDLNIWNKYNYFICGSSVPVSTVFFPLSSQCQRWLGGGGVSVVLRSRGPQLVHPPDADSLQEPHTDDKTSTSWDVDGIHQHPRYLSPRSSPFFRFPLHLFPDNGPPLRVYQFTCLPIGLNWALVLTSVLRPLLFLLHSSKINILAYLNDLIVRDSSPMACTRAFVYRQFGSFSTMAFWLTSASPTSPWSGWGLCGTPSNFASLSSAQQGTY